MIMELYVWFDSLYKFWFKISKCDDAITLGAWFGRDSSVIGWASIVVEPMGVIYAGF